MQDLQSLTYYHQAQELNYIIIAALEGNLRRCLLRIKDLYRGEQERLGLLLWLTNRIIYQIIAIQARDTSYNARLYLPDDSWRYLRELATQVTSSQLTLWLAQLQEIEQARRAQAGSHWSLLIALFASISAHSH